MGRAVAPLTPGMSSRARRSGSLDDEAAIRTYLRLIADVPQRSSDRVGPAETAFIESAAEWAKGAGVDRRTLADVGVPAQVLDAAGIRNVPVADLIRRQYGTSSFTIAEIARRSGVSVASVRNVVAEDERARRVVRLANEGRAVQFGLR
jgi:hypothetical protein